MEKKALKLTAIAAGAILLAGTAFAAPSFAHQKGTSSSSSASKDASDVRGKFKQGAKAQGAKSTLAATITGVPTTVTDLEVAEHSALFMGYEFTTTAPTAQPTTGGRPVHFEATALTNGTVTGNLEFKSPKTAGTYKLAVYTSSTDATADVVTIVVDAAGVATATSSAALTATYDANVTRPTPPAGEKPGKGGKGKGGHGHGLKGGAGWTPTAAPTAPTV
ncbi:MAG: hypothetical protein RJA60_653 [Actinomycetota bacterium]|jgi:hypothetical protein